MLLRSGITKGPLVLNKVFGRLKLDQNKVWLFYETKMIATFTALTAALAMTLGTAPAEQPGYAGHFILWMVHFVHR